MESIVVFILFLVLSSISAKNKKNRKRQSPQRPSMPREAAQKGAMPDGAFAPAREGMTGNAVPKDAFAPKASRRSEKAEKPKKVDETDAKRTLIEQERACTEKPLHLHEVTQAQMRAAGEGEDPCHRGGVGPVADRKRKNAAAADKAAQGASPVYASPFDEDADERRERLREDVVRGLVMSEILTTPKQRRALRRAAAEGGHR